MEIKVYENLVFKKIEDIRPYENNPRVNDRAVDALVEMVPEVGFNQPLVIDKDGVIIKGHGRFEAMKRMGCEVVPCIVSENDDEKNAENRIIDNRLHELSSWDSEKLNCELREMKIDLRAHKVDVPLVRNGVDQVTDVQRGDIERAQNKLIGDDRKTAAEKQDFIEVHCEFCGESFYVPYKGVAQNG